jgi:hypothetical protein
MSLGIAALKRLLTGVLVMGVGACLVSCGGSSTTSNPPSGAKFRAFVSQDVSATTASPGLFIINAQLDRPASASPISAGPSPGLMTVPANHRLTMVFNSSDNELDVVDNAKETASGRVALPSSTESMAATSDGTLGFAAVPDAPVAGLAPGEVELVNLAGPSLQAPLCVPMAGGACVIPNPNIFSRARYIALSPDNTHLLVFGDILSVATLTNIGTTSAPSWSVSRVNVPVAGSSSNLDHPVWATFSQDGNTAYVLSCGSECGGTTASITPLSFNNPQCASQQYCLGASTALPGGATYSASFGSTVYVAGSAACGTGANGASCGKLSIVNTSNNAVQVAKTVNISDGYHNRMAVTSDNQVFVGAQGCTRSCLSIYNANNGNVVIGTDSGDVTGIQPISGRPQVYVVQNGELRNWSTTTDAPATKQLDVVGHAVDVKLVD